MSSVKSIGIDVQHMDCVAWITTNNSYTWDKQSGTWDPKVNLWQGILFQFGDYMSMVGDTLVAFDGVKLMYGRREVLHLPRAAFVSGDTCWVNVVARRMDSGRVDPPMDRNDCRDLLIEAGSVKPVRNYFTPFSGGMKLPDCPPDPWEPADPPCPSDCPPALEMLPVHAPIERSTSSNPA